MSQLQVTGEAKIRDIQGPVVANSGVITALDGAASQYVRGDGTLADFPTSSGGGSSVSYYLNSSVSQGTIGGVAYRELSKDPIIGAGTDIAISANGYVANYITDANDPDVVIVPGGNFNCEFYFSVNNNTGNPTTYAELYKYDGTTFTLLGSSVGVPESINQGTTIAPYYFAIPVATATLAVTDRLAIRIYVNVDSRTVTLHTENGHLCQVVTTLSKGMVSLNNLTDQSQFLAVGTSGTNFAIVSSGDTHTFNIPDASPTARGLITTSTQNIAGSKTFNDAIGANYGIALYNGAIPPITSIYYAALSGNSTGLSITYRTGGGTNYTNNLNFPANNNSYAFPDVTGTMALLEGTQTFTGVKTFSENLKLDGNGSNAGTLLLKSNVAYPSQNGYTAINSNGYILYFQPTVGTVTRMAGFDFSSVSSSVIRTYTLPDATGTLALTSDLGSYVPYSGATTNVDLGTNTLSAGNTKINDTLYLKLATTYAHISGYYGISVGTNIFVINNSASTQAVFSLASLTTSRTFTLPDATGTLALTSNLSAYLPLSGGTLTGALSGTSATFSGNMAIGGSTITDANMLNVIGNQSTVNIGVVLNNTNSTHARIYALQNVNGNFNIRDYTAGSDRLSISSTGAVSFSSSISATTALLNSTSNQLVLQNTAGGSNAEKVGLFMTDGDTFKLLSLNDNNTTRVDNILVANVISGNVGIGTSSPSAKLEITNGRVLLNNGYSYQFYNTAGTAVDTLQMFTDGNVYLDAKDNTGGNLIFRTTNSVTERMRITSGGDVGIGNTGTSGHRLAVKGGGNTSGSFAVVVTNSSNTDLFFIRNDGYMYFGLDTNSPYNIAQTGRSCILASNGSVGYLVSTRESKANIESIKNVDFINQLNPVQFNYRKKDDITNTFTDELEENITYGFIADEVEKVNKDLVFYDNLKDGSKKLAGVEYNNMIAVLTKAIQELKAEIDELKSKII